MSDTQHGSPASDLPQDLLLLVFLRLPPDPQNLLAASLVCKSWRRVVRNPAFLRRFRALHRPPPVLGFFQNLWCGDASCPDLLRHRRLVLRRSTPDPDMTRWALDCRHGRVLLHGSGDQELHVWDPLAGEDRSVSMPPGSQGSLTFAAALICAAGRDDHDHTDCRSTPFQIVFLDTRVRGEDQRFLSGFVYSAATDTWSDATDEFPFPWPAAVDFLKRGALVGDSLYWPPFLSSLVSSCIIEFSLSSHRLKWIWLPDDDVFETYMYKIHVMPAEDGGICFAGVVDGRSDLHSWSRRVDPHGAAQWQIIRTVNLSELNGLPAGDSLLSSCVVGFAVDNDELFIYSRSGLFMLNIKSLRLRKVLQIRLHSTIYPYTSLYTRGRDIAGIDHRDDQ